MPVEDLYQALMHFDHVKFSGKDIMLTAIPHENVSRHLLRGTQVVFLEKGNDRAGLTHILTRHGRDFQRKGIESNEIIHLLSHTITNIKPLNVSLQSRGLSVDYAFDDSIHPDLKHDVLKIALGFNGFIVSAMPIGLSTVMGSLRTIAGH
ncbi:MAG: hypothetical protein ACI910_002807 [Oleispira sp.]|jgi:hypothetical protein